MSVEKNNVPWLFIPCLMDSFYPEAATALVSVFNKLSLEYFCPIDQTCCGQPAFNAGHINEARIIAKRFISLFEDAAQIVCPSGSCVKMIRQHYPVLFQHNPDWEIRARAVANKTYELTEYLVDFLKIESIQASFQGRVAYHDGCSLYYGLGIYKQPRRLLQSIPGLELVEISSAGRCCGFGGMFALKYPDLSLAIAEEKVRDILATGADTLITSELGCMLNLEGIISRQGQSIRCLLLTQVLAS